MTDNDAKFKADEFIKLILQHQPNLFGSTPLDSLDSAKKVAQSLAALRAGLIAQLTPQ